MIRIFGKSDKGLVRLTNEDSFRIIEFSKEAYLAVVCDGMGGENGGDIASSIAVDRISEMVGSNFYPDMNQNSIRDMLLTAIAAANAVIFSKSNECEHLKGMGTTVIACMIVNNVAYIANAGDSRAYYIFGDDIVQITKDHTMVQMYLEQGKITEEEARVHPQRHYITRALGVNDKIDVDYCEMPMDLGQKIIICTDGLTNYLNSEEILNTVRDIDPEYYTDILIDHAVNMGGADNITVVLIEAT